MTLGVIMLDTAFTRFPGDIGSPESFAGPVLFKTVPSATARRIVGIWDEHFLGPFLAAVTRLILRGAKTITTSCGYLVIYQGQMATDLGARVATSALLLVPTLQRLVPEGSKVGVLTFSKAKLAPIHLSAAGAAADTPVEGLPEGGGFQAAILGDPRHDSFERREDESVRSATRLISRHPEVAAIVLECTNLAPHRAAIEKATGRPVYDIWTLLALLAGRRLDLVRA